MTFISTWTKKERDEKGSKGQRRSVGQRDPEKLVAVYTAQAWYHQASANLNSMPPFILRAFLKRQSLFCWPTLDNSNKYTLNVDQEKQTCHHFSPSGSFSMIRARPLLLSLKWLKLRLSNRRGRGTPKAWRFLNYLGTQEIKQSTKEHSLLKVASFGNTGLKENFTLFRARP